MLGFFCVCAMPTSAAVSAAVSDIICPFLNLSRVSASASLCLCLCSEPPFRPLSLKITLSLPGVSIFMWL